jgi:hypothetical protein
MLPSALLDLAILVAVAVAYSLVAWLFSRRMGRWVLLVCWPLAALAWSFTLILRYQHAAPQIGVALPREFVTLIITGGGLAFGCATWVLVRSPSETPWPRPVTVAKTVGAFLIGLFLGLIPALIEDLGRLWR